MTKVYPTNGFPKSTATRSTSQSIPQSHAQERIPPAPRPPSVAARNSSRSLTSSPGNTCSRVGIRQRTSKANEASNSRQPAMAWKIKRPALSRAPQTTGSSYSSTSRSNVVTACSSSASLAHGPKPPAPFGLTTSTSTSCPQISPLSSKRLKSKLSSPNKASQREPRKSSASLSWSRIKTKTVPPSSWKV